MRCALFALALYGSAAHATTMIPLDLPALATRADRVVLGTVLASESKWTADHRTIYTTVTLRVDRSYKGALKQGETLTIVREGGTADGIGMHVFGAAHFDVGEQAVVFVEKRANGWSYVVGMAQGKMRVEMLAGKRIVRAPDTSGIAMLPSRNAAQPPGTRPLEDFEAELRAVLVEKSK